jgi:hypothetical protein
MTFKNNADEVTTYDSGTYYFCPTSLSPGRFRTQTFRFLGGCDDPSAPAAGAKNLFGNKLTKQRHTLLIQT